MQIYLVYSIIGNKWITDDAFRLTESLGQNCFGGRIWRPIAGTQLDDRQSSRGGGGAGGGGSP